MFKLVLRKSVIFLIVIVILFFLGQVENEKASATTPTIAATPTLPPTVKIIEPLNYDLIASTSAIIRYVESGDLSQVDHVHLQLDSQPEIRDLDNNGVYVFKRSVEIE